MPKNMAMIMESTAIPNAAWQTAPYASAMASRTRPGGGLSVSAASVVSRAIGVGSFIRMPRHLEGLRFSARSVDEASHMPTVRQ
jgi:hypothetical protein